MFRDLSLPLATGKEPLDDSRAQAIAQAAKELDEKRRAWLDPPDASEVNLKKRTLTNLYNQRPTWLASACGAGPGGVGRVWVVGGWGAGGGRGRGGAGAVAMVESEAEQLILSFGVELESSSVLSYPIKILNQTTIVLPGN